MNVKSVEKEKNSAKIVVEVDKELFETGLNKAYLKLRGKIMLPGFRKGKAPRKMIESMYGKEVFYEDAINEIFPEVYKEAVLGQDIKAVGMPSVSDMDVSEDGILTLTIATDLYPEVTLGQYKGLEIEKAEATVSEEEIDAEIDRMAQNVARIETVDGEAKDGDIAVIDFEGFKDGVAFAGGKGENHELKLGSGQFIPGFEDQVIGMKAGEEKEINVTFPEDYNEESLAGQPVIFKVKCNEVKQTIVPEKDDEFVKDVSEFDTMSELRADLKKKALEEKTAGIQRAFENAAIEKAAANMTADIPESMIEEAVDKEMQQFEYDLRRQGASVEQYAKMLGADINTFRGYVRPGAINQLKSQILLNAVVDAEKIEVSDDEIEEEFKSIADSYKMELDKVKEMVTSDDLKGDISVRKAAKLIAESAVAIAPKEEEKKEDAE
ncbi:MAG: trigger factor [Clostridia bacterium]|nr:trigger factor [Clostridia bacterium]